MGVEKLKEFSEEQPPYVGRDYKKNVILVDDDPAFRRLVELTSKYSNLNITAVESLHYLSSPHKIASYDAIILDYFLEGSDGLKVAQYTNAFFPNIPVILISGQEMLKNDGNWPDCISMFCSKDVGVANIFKIVDSVIDQSKK